MRSIWILALVILAACGTPQERCIATATREVRILDRLIGEVQGNLTRGYAMEEVVLTRDRWVVCRRGRPATATEPAVAPEMCLREYDYVETRPKAINLADEREKLAELKAKRVAVARSAERAVASCKATYPE